MLRTIEIWPKMNSFFSHFCEFFSTWSLHSEPKRKYLKSPRIRENREIHIHKLMQSTKRFNHLTARTKIAMIIVYKHYLRSNLLNLIDCYSLHSRASPYGHKYRGMDISMWSSDSSRSSKSIGCIQRKRKMLFRSPLRRGVRGVFYCHSFRNSSEVYKKSLKMRDFCKK